MHYLASLRQNYSIITQDYITKYVLILVLVETGIWKMSLLQHDKSFIDLSFKQIFEKCVLLETI